MKCTSASRSTLQLLLESTKTTKDVTNKYLKPSKFRIIVVIKFSSHSNFLLFSTNKTPHQILDGNHYRPANSTSDWLYYTLYPMA